MKHSYFGITDRVWRNYFYGTKIALVRMLSLKSDLSRLFFTNEYYLNLLTHQTEWRPYFLAIQGFVLCK